MFIYKCATVDCSVMFIYHTNVNLCMFYFYIVFSNVSPVHFHDILSPLWSEKSYFERFVIFNVSCVFIINIHNSAQKSREFICSGPAHLMRHVYVFLCVVIDRFTWTPSSFLEFRRRFWWMFRLTNTEA